MADHRLVDAVIGWLRDNWDESNYPGTEGSGTSGAGLYGEGLYSGHGEPIGELPAFIDGDNSTSEEFEGRRVKFDPERTNAIVVSSSPNRIQEPVGTEFDYRFEDGVSIRIAGLERGRHFGHLSSAMEFQQLVGEVRRVIHDHRTLPDLDIPNTGGLDARIEDETNLSSQYRDWYEYDMTVVIRGFESLP